MRAYLASLAREVFPVWSVRVEAYLFRRAHERVMQDEPSYELPAVAYPARKALNET
jgi:hypothetical protein